MFNKSNRPVDTTKKRRSTDNPDAAVTILTSGCHFNGKLYCRGSSRIGGRIEGQIVSEGLLIIEDGATIVGEIAAEEAVIQGHVKGKLLAKIRVELCKTCRFEGDITSPSLVVNEGAQFNGKSVMVISSEQGERNLRSIDGFADKSSSEHEPSPITVGEQPGMRVPEVNVRS